MTAKHDQPTQVHQKIAQGLQNELALTLRMLADNVWIMAVPVIIVAITAAHAKNSPNAPVPELAFATAWAILLAYAFDAVNQAVGAEEDQINKPYRPIPSGLATPRGMWMRSCISSALFIVLGFTGGAISITVSILYILTVLWVYLFAPRRRYWSWKPVANGIAVVCQFNGAWAISGEHHMQVFCASIVCACVWAIPGQIEDARDINGDIKQGRVTLATLFGARAVSLLFALTTGIILVVAGVILWANSAYSPGPSIFLIIVCGLAWSATFMALQARSNTEYRRLFQIFCVVHIMFTTFYCSVLW